MMIGPKSNWWSLYCGASSACTVAVMLIVGSQNAMGHPGRVRAALASAELRESSRRGERCQPLGSAVASVLLIERRESAVARRERRSGLAERSETPAARRGASRMLTISASSRRRLRRRRLAARPGSEASTSDAQTTAGGNDSSAISRPAGTVPDLDSPESVITPTEGLIAETPAANTDAVNSAGRPTVSRPKSAESEEVGERDGDQTGDSQPGAREEDPRQAAKGTSGKRGGVADRKGLSAESAAAADEHHGAVRFQRGLKMFGLVMFSGAVIAIALALAWITRTHTGNQS